MPRFFFHIHRGTLMRDLEGKSLPSVKAAWDHGVRACGELIRDLDGALEPECEWRVEVSDEKGATLFRLRFKAECFVTAAAPAS